MRVLELLVVSPSMLEAVQVYCPAEVLATPCSTACRYCSVDIIVIDIANSADNVDSVDIVDI